MCQGLIGVDRFRSISGFPRPIPTDAQTPVWNVKTETDTVEPLQAENALLTGTQQAHLQQFGQSAADYRTGSVGNGQINLPPPHPPISLPEILQVV